jgi:xylulokinase
VSGDDLVVGVDCSTHAAKAVAFNLKGQMQCEARCAFPLLTPRPGYYEQSAHDWVSATLASLTDLARQCSRPIRAIGITHQRETFVGIDERDEPVRNAIVWMDERAAEQVQALAVIPGPQAFHRITGKPLSMTPSISKIAWIRDHEPQAFRRATRWLDVGGLLVRALTGSDVTSIGSADPMGLVDIAAARFSDPILQSCGLSPDQLPKLVAVGTIAGTLLPTVASSTGLDPSTPVVVTAGDGQVAALGAQVFGLDHAYLNLGTAIVSGTVSQKLVLDSAFRTMTGALPGTWLLESDLKGGTFTIDWLCDRLLAGAASPASLEPQAAALSPGSDGLLLVPYFAGVMNPYWDDDATGIVVGLRGSHTPAHLFRAILEGVALEQRLHLREIERAAEASIAEVRVMGGGACSPLWCQILADVLQRRVVRAQSVEATSLGAAMLAAAAVGLFASVRDAACAMGSTAERFEPGEHAQHYERLFDEVYVRLYPALRPMLSRLAALTRSSPT